MRNSFAHGFYKIDYLPGFKSGNLEDIIFTFEDYDLDKTTNNKVKVFELSITANSLYQLLKEFSERIFNNTEQLQYKTLGVLTNINHHNKNIKKQADYNIKKLEEKYGPIAKL